MATWTDPVNVVYQAVMTSTLVNTILENLRYLKEKVDASGAGAWTDAVLISGWSVPSGHLAPQYRTANGFIEWRGSAQYNSAIASGGVANMVNCPAPLPTDAFAVRLVCATGSPTVQGQFNPRTDGVARLYVDGALSANTPVYLHGLRYPVTA